MARRVDGYAEDMRRALRPLKKAATRARKLGRDPRWMAGARQIVAANNRQVFASDGDAIGTGTQWVGRDYVDTGATRNDLTSPARLKGRVAARRISFAPRVKYWKFIGPALTGWTVRAEKLLAVETADHLKRVGDGKAP